MFELGVINESLQLKSVILGIGDDFGGIPKLEETYDPKSRMHLANGTFPKEADIIKELDNFRKVLEKHDVNVMRPENVRSCNQVFARDVGFTINNSFIISNVIDKRSCETEGILSLVKEICQDCVVHAPEEVSIEGGDIMPWNEYIFVGYSEEADFNKYEVSRTNRKGVEFLKQHFPEKKVIGFELKKSDDNPYENALHLDCCFQPFGTKNAIIHQQGFKNKKDYEFLVNHFGKDNIIEIDKNEMFEMNSNIFSINKNTVVSDPSFTRLNEELRKKNFRVEEVSFKEISKMEGLFRCTTLPLKRI